MFLGALLPELTLLIEVAVGSALGAERERRSLAFGRPLAVAAVKLVGPRRAVSNPPI